MKFPLLAAFAATLVACSDDPAPLDATTPRDATADTADAPKTTDLGDDTGPANCQGSGLLLETNQVYRTVAGVDPNLLSLDAYKPVRDARCPPSQFVIYVHGGQWTSGDKNTLILNKARYFAAYGAVFVSVNHRLSADTTGDGGTTTPVRYPTHNEDVAAAIAWLRDHADHFHARADRMVLLGHDSGGAIVTSLSTDPRYLTAAGMRLDQLACTAVLDAGAYDVRAQIEGGAGTAAVYRNAFGDDPATWDAASPLRNGTVAMGRGIPRFLVVSRGASPDIAPARRFTEALSAAGVTARLVDADPLTSQQVNDVVGLRSDMAVMPPLDGFVRACLGLPNAGE